MARSKPTRKARRDANEGGIIEALTHAGAIVCQIDGADVPDLLVGFRGETFLVEVKNRATYGKLSEGQAQWFEDWLGGPVAVIHTDMEALAFIGAIDTE